MTKKKAKTKNKGGRPSRAEQLEIGKAIRPFFDAQLTIYTTSKISNINIKTVAKYFKDWADILVKSQEKSFLDREEAARNRTLLSLDRPISQILNQLQFFEKKINKAREEETEPDEDDLEKARALAKDLADLQLKRGGLEMQPPTKYVLEKEVEIFVAAKRIEKQDTK